jgi:ABC-type nitrate/sulfonate/bicarbonate transport system substrate-binding protein
MSARLDRRTFLRRAVGAAGWGLALPLFAACQQAAAPAKPTEAPKPAAEPTKPAAAPAAQPAASPAAPAAAATAVAPAAPTKVTKVSYAFASVNPYHYVAVIAAEKPDLPRKFGIEFDLVTTTNSPNAVNALVGGSVDVAVSTPDSVWPAQDKAPDVKQLMATADGTPYALIVQPEIKKAADLKSKTLGASAVRGGADTTAIKVMLFENGLKEGDYTIVQAGAVSDRTQAMKAKSIQGLAQLEPQATLLRDEGFPEIDNADYYPALKNVHSIVLSAKKSWYEGNAEVAVNFVRAWMDITKWIYDPKNKDEIIAISKKTMSVGDKPAENGYNLHVVKSKTVSQDLRINEKYMQQFIDNLKKAGGENLPTDPMKYVDGSLVEKALKA